MYLKALEIIGFKSFSDKVELKFSPGITAIVGPNGCGKSNLVDAIRWVLGEQRAKLMRGSKMEELLFNGTSRRKAINFAEVSLILDNTDQCLPLDFREVVVTRRMYRSGEGEYYLNRTSCRLKDILELFWDTGVGTEAYSLVGQGRVEQIINARPEDRREIFEEAAEIFKYKQKKRETGSRLEEMKVNMVRLEDLLVELKDRQEHLSQAAELARRYRDLQLQLQDREQKLFQLRWNKNSSLQKKVLDEQSRLEGLISEKKANLDSMGQKMGLLIREEDRLSGEEGIKRKEYQQLKTVAEELRHKLGLLQEHRKFAREKSTLKEEAFLEVQSRLEGIEKTYRQNEDELQNVKQELDDIGARALDLQQRLKTARSSDLIAFQEMLKGQLAEARSATAVMEHALQDNELRCRELEERIDQLQERLEAKKQDKKRWEKEEENFRAVLARLEEELADRAKELVLLRKHFRDFSDHHKVKKEKHQQAVRELEKMQARFKILRENEDEYTAYAGGVRAVMQAVGRDSSLQGIHGPVAGLINVSQNFEKAIEVALGGALQFIVVEDDRAARAAIAFLKEKKAGRATFLPLTLLKLPARREIPAVEDGFLGVASRVVEFPDKFKKAVEYLLGGVLVARDLETALRILRRDKSGYRIVTLDGEMITSGGAISGGLQSRERSGLLQRKRELTSLQKEIEEMQRQLAQREKELSQESQKILLLEEEEREFGLKQKKLEEELAAKRHQVEKCRAERNRIGAEMKELEQDKTSVQAKHNLLVEQGRKKSLELEQNRKIVQKLTEELAQAGRRVNQEEIAFRQLEEELMDVRVKFSALQEKESSCRELLHRQKREKERLVSLAETLSAEQEKALAEMEKLVVEEDTLAMEIKQKFVELARKEKLAEELSRQLEVCRRTKNELGTERDKEQRSLERFERRYYQLNLEKARLVEESRYLREHYRERFGSDPGAVAEVPVEESEEQLQEEKESIAGGILALGEVNMGAIEEYERLQERIKFLENQRDDLLQGEKGMRKVLAELDQEMEKRFLQALHSVGNHFLETFTGLFGGGQAFLKLTDPENVLESGIEIIAQPPGKKLQNISLLSGGEKALTSIALLFAVLKYKPVPFCLLDEIESSLDDSNIERFLGFLKKYSEKTQFILITHRRKTMEEADVLYGVTMEEQGISKVLSLNLKKKAG